MGKRADVFRGTCVGSLCLLAGRDSVGCICVCVHPHMHASRQLWAELDPEVVLQDSHDLTRGCRQGFSPSLGQPPFPGQSFR